jgi:penicillin-binding protein 1A
MGQHGYLDAVSVKKFSQEPVRVLSGPGPAYVGAYFSDYVVNVLKQKTNYNERFIRTAGLKIYTTMDRNIQAQAERVINILPQQGADRWGIMQPQGAVVVIDPKNGQVLALVGGRRFSDVQPNRAFQIFRQPGSAIKPFVYAAALESGYTAEQKLIDQPLEITVNGKPWRPQNYDNKYRGPITLRAALEESVNTIAVQLVQKMGPANVFQVAKRMVLPV